MNEIMMRMMAQLYGYEVMSFCAEYKENGQDRHRPVQVTHPHNDREAAALGVQEQLLMQGFVPQAVLYYPGDYTMEQLENIVDENPPRHVAQLMYLAPEAYEEIVREHMRANHEAFRSGSKS